MKSQLLLIAIFLFIPSFLLAQSEKLIELESSIDSLKDEDKYGVIIEVAEEYINYQPEKSLYYLNSLIEEIGKPSKKDYKKGVLLSDAYYSLGQTYLTLSEGKEAEYAFLQSFNLAKKYDYTYGKDRSEKMLNDLGISTGTWWDRQKNNINNLQINEKFKSATEELQESAKNIGENIKETRIDKLDEQAQEEHSNKNYYSAIKSYQKALVLSKELNNKQNVFDHYLLLADLYKEVGNTNFAVQHYDSAIFLVKSWPTKSGDNLLVDSLNQIKNQLKNKLHPNASIAIAPEKINAKPLTIDTTNALENEILISVNKLEESKKKIASLDEDFKKSVEKGDYEKALQYKELYFASQLKLARDSIEIDNLQNQKRIQEYEINEQKNLIEQERKTKIYLGSIAALVGFLAIAMYYLFITKKKSHKNLQSTYKELEDTHKELKSAQTKLVESEKMASLGQLTAGIAHEINNPINFVTSNINPIKKDIEDLREFYKAFNKYQSQSADKIPAELMLLKEELEIDFLFTEIDELLNGVEEGAVRTKKIVESFRSFARLDEEGFKQVDIESSVNSTLSLLKNKIEDKINIETELSELPKIECQPGKLNQLLFHILNNSVQAIEACKLLGNKGLINVSGWIQDEETLFLSIRDNGIGIEECIKSKVFDPFFTTKNVGEGKGLGLSIAYGIMQEHCGDISFESVVGDSSFTEFQISIPVKHTHTKSEYVPQGIDSIV
ncbi:ATP-binding protein [Chondrinema litorale]|uniref:ATP-binding protein n=1 Tax=Chondrinema litorale TaxID=2994555 RepID=UPI0025439ADA|nr:ATP-binding protein [Chondrinema litorale]UZR95982.1 ATP-binding protein [Chondrinema litorale]